MIDTKIEQKPRETTYRNWMRVARVTRWAPFVAAMAVLALVATGRLPEHWAQLEYLAAVMLPFLGVCLIAIWLAGRRYEAMAKEWGHRKAVRWGYVENDLQKRDH